jgi:hypothetical protein
MVVNKEMEEVLEEEMHRVTSMLGFLIEAPDDFIEDAVIGKKMMARNVLRMAAASFWVEEMIKRLSKRDKDFEKGLSEVKSILEIK